MSTGSPTPDRSVTGFTQESYLAALTSGDHYYTEASHATAEDLRKAYASLQQERALNTERLVSRVQRLLNTRNFSISVSRAGNMTVRSLDGTQAYTGAATLRNVVLEHIRQHSYRSFRSES